MQPDRPELEPAPTDLPNNRWIPFTWLDALPTDCDSIGCIGTTIGVRRCTTCGDWAPVCTDHRGVAGRRKTGITPFNHSCEKTA